jgi:serine/threonine-protein phosphatase 2A regulatory subunit A
LTTNELSQTLAPVVTLSIIQEHILPIMDRLVSDPIPNIRFNVAKSYAVLIDTLRRLPAEGTLAEAEAESTPSGPSAKGQDLISTQILPNLEKLQQDDDADVRYFATTAAGGKPTMQESSEKMDTEQ